MKTLIVPRSPLLFLTVLCFLSFDGHARAAPEEASANRTSTADHTVRVTPGGLTRGGKPYFVQGVGGSGSMKELAARGGNSVRTWSTKGLKEILDEAEGLGLTVSAGIWLEPECSWFSYSNQEHCDKQAVRVKSEVEEYRAHPALLAWGIGNEVEGDGTNIAFWKQLDRLAKLVKEADPNHPTFTAVAGFSKAKIDGVNTHVPHLDFVGINTYGAVFGLRKQLAAMGWTRPWMLTEWGPRGFWEVGKGPGKAPLEQTSTEKADMIRKAYKEVIFPGGGCLGNYAFVWGWKFEATATWFGIYTHEGDTTAVADVLQEAWTGKLPANQAPAIQKLNGAPKQPIAPGTTFEADVTATDPDADPLTWQWMVLREPKVPIPQKNMPMPASEKDSILRTSGSSATIQAPSLPGIYRLHVWVKDGKGHAASANTPFAVAEK